MTEQPSVDATMCDRCLTVRLGGDMDHESAPFFRNRLLDEITGNQRYVVLDLSAVSFCDSSGLNVLLWARQRADKTGAMLVLASVPPPLRRMLDMTGVDTVLRVFGTLAEAEKVMTLNGA